MESGDLDPNGPCFAGDMLKPIFSFSPSKMKKLVVAIVAPWWPMGIAASKFYKTGKLSQMLILAVPFYGWVALEVLQIFDSGLAYMGWAILFGFIACGTGLRSNMRDKFGINGNIFEDFFAVLLAYPLAAIQMEEHMRIAGVLDEESNSDSSRTSSERMAEADEKVPLKGKSSKRGKHGEEQVKVTIL